jgi:NAD(P)H-dependent flavin oxidoreductase YrpB (nitropropane dioxygenase family)
MSWLLCGICLQQQEDKPMISTRLTRMLGIRHPVVQAGMGGVARADLVAAVSNAGGLGKDDMVMGGGLSQHQD